MALANHHFNCRLLDPLCIQIFVGSYGHWFQKSVSYCHRCQRQSITAFRSADFHRKCRFHALSGNVGRVQRILSRPVLLPANMAKIFPFYFGQLWCDRHLSILLERPITEKVEHESNGSDRKATDGKAIQAREKLGLQVAIWATLLQLVFGTILLLSFERSIMLLYMGDDMLLTTLLVSSIFLTLAMAFFLYKLQKHDVKRYFVLALSSFLLVLSIMGWMRHELRESYLKPYIEENPRTVHQADRP